MAEHPGSRHVPEPTDGRHPVLHPLMRAGFIEFDRVVFFSDAVFAIAITLLAITLRVPKHGTAHELREAIPSIFGFGISFLVIAFFWIGHHGIFRYITAIDRRLIAFNLGFLALIAFLPYPTNVLSSSSPSTSASVIFYATCCGLAGLLEAAIWMYATRPGGGLASPDAREVRTLYLARMLRVPVVFALSVPVAVWFPEQAPFVWLLIGVSARMINRFWPLREMPESSPDGANESGSSG